MIPVGDFVRRNTTPYVNWTLIGINVAVFIYMLATNVGDKFFYDWGFVPACIADYFGDATDVPARELAAYCPSGGREPLQLITSLFVHGGWAHIAGNMLFLWIFGDNVEDRMGHGRYLVFYLICGLVASATQTYLATDTIVPTVGASGAIAGVMGAYLVLHPTAIVQVVIFPLFFIPFFVPAVVLIGFWFVTQLFAGVAELGNTTAGSDIAWWAHVGGFIAGAVLIWLFRRKRSPGFAARLAGD